MQWRNEKGKGASPFPSSSTWSAFLVGGQVVVDDRAMPAVGPALGGHAIADERVRHLDDAVQVPALSD